MQHLVKQNVFDCITRHPRMIKNAADDNRIVRRIVMPQTAARLFSAPGELRAPHQAMKKSPVQIVENFFQMIMISARRMNVLASSHLPDEPRLRRNIVACDITAITRALCPINWLAIELREQYVGDRMQYRFRSAFQQIGEPRIDLSLPQSNRIVNRNKRIEAKMHRRGGRARPQFAINFMKNFAQLLRHVEGRVARLCRKQDCQNAKSKSADHQRFAPETAPVICPCETRVPSVVKICADTRNMPPAPARSPRYFFFLRFMYSSTSATVLRWSSALESTVSSASVRTNSYSLASEAFVLADVFSARNFD